MIADNYLQLRSRSSKLHSPPTQTELRHAPRPRHLDTLHGLLTDIREPLLFVVVGEVKAGKSSLLNALFGQNLQGRCAPGDRSGLHFRYGQEKKRSSFAPHSPSAICRSFLRDFNVVDTPGTNTMVAEHQTITESFIPRADLVLFVFSVVNPWSQSAWELLIRPKKWLKNIVFVLQQADLREPRRSKSSSGISRTRPCKNWASRRPFSRFRPESAPGPHHRLDKERLWQESEFGPLEEQINRMVTESRAGILKLQ